MLLIHVRCTNCGEIQSVDSRKEAAVCKNCKEAYVVQRALARYEEIKKLAGVDSVKEDIVFYENDAVYKNERGRAAITDHYLTFKGIKGNSFVFEISYMEDICAKENMFRRGINFGRMIPNSIYFHYNNHKQSVFFGSGRANELVEMLKGLKSKGKTADNTFDINVDFNELEHFSMEDIDSISQLTNSKKKGDLFERYCARLLELNNFMDVQVVGGTGDMGADIIAWKARRKVVIQCKCYKGTVAYHALEQTVTARKNFAAGDAIILTNGYFSEQTQRIAPEHQILLWDRDKLQVLIETANEIMKSHKGRDEEA